MKQDTWTPEEDNILKELVKYKTQSEIAARLNRTVKSVERRKSRLGLKNIKSIKQGSLECLVCGLGVADNFNLYKHIHLEHNLTPTQYKEKFPTSAKFRCQYCETERSTKEFISSTNSKCMHCATTYSLTSNCSDCNLNTTWNGLLTHIKYYHNENYKEFLEARADKVVKKCIECDQVKYLFNYEEIYDRKCNSCKKHYPKESSIFNTDLFCSICSTTEGINTNKQLYTHLRNEHAIEPKKYFQDYSTVAFKICTECHHILSSIEFDNANQRSSGKATKCKHCTNTKTSSVLSCPYCNLSVSVSRFKNHIIYTHKENLREAFKTLGHKYCNKCKDTLPLDNFLELDNDEKPFSFWCITHLEKEKARKAAQRHFNTSKDVEFYGLLRATIRLAFNDMCFLCNTTHDQNLYAKGESLHIDHIMPRSNGGDNNIENSMLLCSSCNLQKGDKNIDEFFGMLEYDEEYITYLKSKLQRIHNWALVEFEKMKGLG